MSKRFIALAAASIALALAVSFYARAPRAQTGADVRPNHVTPSNVSGERPTQGPNRLTSPDDDYIAYRHVFAHIYSEARGKEKSNHDVNSAVELYRVSVPLSDDETNVLAKIALETETRALAIEEHAATIIKSFRERIDAELKSGRKLSSEPPELQTLQKQRVSTTLQGKDDLRRALGESTFAKFDKFLKEGLNLTIEKAVPSTQSN